MALVGPHLQHYALMIVLQALSTWTHPLMSSVVGVGLQANVVYLCSKLSGTRVTYQMETPKPQT